MKKTVFFLVIFFTINSLIPIAKASTGQCFITNHVAAKPNPSLIQCYKNNPSACCNSLADSYISSIYNDMLSKSCARSYPYLEAYFCLACSPSQPYAVDSSAGVKTIQICKSLVEKFWSSDITKRTENFDNCGMSVVWGGEDQGEVILPSTYFSTAQNFVDTIKPPFFEDYTIQIVDDALYPNCYASGSILKASILTFIGIFLLACFV